MESLFTCHICPGHLTYPSKLPGTVLGNSEIGPLDIQSYLPAFSLFFSHTIPSLTVFLLYFLSRSLFDRFLITYPFPLTLVMLLLHILTSIFKHFILLHISWSFFTICISLNDFFPVRSLCSFSFSFDLFLNVNLYFNPYFILKSHPQFHIHAFPKDF